MKQNLINMQHIEGRVYESKLELKTVKRQDSPNFGTEFIQGTVSIAVDDQGTNIIDIYFPYVTKERKNFAVLEQIMNGATWIVEGPDKALTVSVDGNALALNDFYSTQRNEMVSAKRNEGGFISLVRSLNPDENKRNTFTIDFLATSTINIEPDEEKGTKEGLRLKGAIFNYRGDLLPVDFVIYDPNGIAYFEGCGISSQNPLFTKISGNIVSTVVQKTLTEEGSFGGALVRTYQNKNKEWVITWASGEPYEFGGDDLTAEELTKKMQDREVHLAEVKSRTNTTTASGTQPGNFGIPVSGSIPSGGFNF